MVISIAMLNYQRVAQNGWMVYFTEHPGKMWMIFDDLFGYPYFGTLSIGQ
jgi:hypothetical protein